MLNESTNIEEDGSATPYGENDIKESFDTIMEKYDTSRVIISCFSSQVHRMQNIVTSAAEHGRKVAFAGFSMVQKRRDWTENWSIKYSQGHCCNHGGNLQDGGQ